MAALNEESRSDGPRAPWWVPAWLTLLSFGVGYLLLRASDSVPATGEAPDPPRAQVQTVADGAPSEPAAPAVDASGEKRVKTPPAPAIKAPPEGGAQVAASGTTHAAKTRHIMIVWRELVEPKQVEACWDKTQIDELGARVTLLLELSDGGKVTITGSAPDPRVDSAPDQRDEFLSCLNEIASRKTFSGVVPGKHTMTLSRSRRVD